MSGGTPSAIRTVGGLLPRDLLARVAQGDRDLEGTKQASYHVPKNERLGERIDQSWSRLRGLWESFREGGELGPSEHHIGPTRSQWLLPLFESLGYGRLQPSSAVEIEGKSFAISHFWGPVPIHLVGAGMSIDRRTPGAPGGARAAPHSLVQEFLNRSGDSLWAFVSNGLVLRVLRDNDALSRQAYVEFDLEAILDGELYADFRLLWLICHQSRLEGGRPEDCWLERWFQTAREDGVRALDDLRDGVEKAIEALGAGFLKHPENEALRERLSEVGAADQYYRELLRLVYRLIFLFVAEDREALLDPSAPAEAKDRYSRYYHSARIRALAGRRRGTSHSDLWTGLRTVLEHLYEGCEPLGLPALGSFLWSPDAVPWIADQALRNDDLLLAVRHLCYTEKDRNRFPVNWRTLGAEELGSVYESLLELHPRMNREAGQFELDTAAGSERKTTGSYYTPTSLVDALLDSALEPVLERAMKEDHPEKALLDLKVCDTAAGSGHFLVAAARRIAMRLASVRTGDEEASPEALTHALRDVIGRCVYGVDLNPLAVELCKVSLWMEALEPGKPLSFLDHHIQVGNSLLGTTPKLMAVGIPDDAFKPIEGDERAVSRDLRQRNSLERRGQTSLHAALVAEDGANYGSLEGQASELSQSPDDSLSAVRAKEAQWRKLRDDPAHRRERMAADAWCAAFVWPLVNGAPTAVTESVFRQIQADPSSVPSSVLTEVNSIADRHGFFHFHLAFIEVFSSIEVDEPENPLTGWSGGFDVVLGNPPWERLKLEEREWFATRAPRIASAPNAAARRRLIRELETEDPSLYESFRSAKRYWEGLSHFLRLSGRYPLCGRGRDINSFLVFSELGTHLLGATGRLGLVVPSAVATDNTGKFFFQQLVSSHTLLSLYDFENREGVFPGVHRSYKFCLLTVSGASIAKLEGIEFAFFLHGARELHDPGRKFRLSPEEIRLLNPNTGTCPIFRSRRDATITSDVYRRTPVLLEEGADNSWGLKTRPGLFHMSNHAELFQTVGDSDAQSGQLVPLYEAKMIHQFDHRWATHHSSSFESVSKQQREDASFVPTPRYWVDSREVDSRNTAGRSWHLCVRDITRSTDERTVISAIVPFWGVGGTLMLAETQQPLRTELCLLAALNSLVLDYIARQKVPGIHLNPSVFKQLPVPSPSAFEQPAAWSKSSTLVDWVSCRAVELSFTSAGFSALSGHDESVSRPFRWSEDRRQTIRAELDGAFFHQYGIERDDVDYILDTFPIVKRKDVAEHGEYRTKRLILEIFDAMHEAIKTGESYQTRLDPPPGDPRAAHPMAATGSG